MMIALAIRISGHTGLIAYDRSWYIFMSNLNANFKSWEFQIPNIPSIPYANADFWGIILNVVIFIANLMVKMFNTLLTLANFVIAALQLIATLVWTLFENFPDFHDGTLPFENSSITNSVMPIDIPSGQFA